MKGKLKLILLMLIVLSSCSEPESYARYVVYNSMLDSLRISSPLILGADSSQLVAPNQYQEILNMTMRGTVTQADKPETALGELIITQLSGDTLDDPLNEELWELHSLGDGKKKESWQHEYILRVDSLDFD